MRIRLLSATIVLLGLSSLAAWGQSTASLSGTVTDPSGAVVAGAHVTVHNLGTGLDRVVDTDAAGLYDVPSLQPGDYKVQASARGFSAYVVPKVTLDVDRQVTVNMRLAVSSAGETVQVESAVQQIEAQTITVGQVIDNTAVQELPLNGRHFLDLTVLTPGGVIADAAGSLTAASRGLGANSFITAGNREDCVNFQINGINLNDISQNQITFQPSISTTSEFKIDNSTFSAQYGRSDGSIVTVATRSGTDKFHGEAFDYFRNEALDARNYFNRPFNPATGLPLVANTGDKAPLKRDNFGGSVWRASLEASHILLRQLRRPAPAPGHPAEQPGVHASESDGDCSEQDQRADRGGAGRTDSAAQQRQTTTSRSRRALYRSISTPATSCSSSAPAIRCTASMLSRKTSALSRLCRATRIPGWGDHRAAHRQIGTLSETHIFNPNIVNEVRLGFNRISIAFNPANTIDPTSVGLGDGLSGKVGLPQTTLSDIGLIFGGPSGFPQGRDDTTGVLADTVTMLKGKHTIKWGGEFRRYLVAASRETSAHHLYHFDNADQSLSDGSGNGVQHAAEYRLPAAFTPIPRQASCRTTTS